MRYSNVTSGIRGRRAAALIGCLLLISLLSSLTCRSGVSSPRDYGSWSFSGYVIDGYTQAPLPRVGIAYLDKDGTEQEVVTDSSGKFFISELPFGDRSFRFAYRRPDSSASLYTQKILLASSLTESRSIDGLFGDVSKVVTLYPLVASASGEIFVKLTGSSKTLPARNVCVAIAYKDSNLIAATPVAFSSATDSGGRFCFVNLPLAPGAQLTVSGYAVNGITYSCDPLTIAQLFKARVVPLGTIFLNAKDTTQMSLGRVHSNVLSADGFGLTQVPVDCKPWYLLPVVLMPTSIDISIAGGGSPGATARMSGDTVFVVPVKRFTYDSLVAVTITGADTAGNRVAFAFDGARRFKTEPQRFPAVRSNVLSSDGYGLTNVSVDVQPWYILPVALDSSSIDAVIAGGGSPDASVRMGGDTVFVIPAKRFGYDSLVTVTITGLDSSGNHVEFVFDSTKRFKTEKGSLTPVRSNVLSTDGYGLTGVSVEVKPWYALPVAPVPSSITVVISGGGSPDGAVRVSGDTVFITPAKRFEYDSLVTIAITGQDTAGNRIQYVFDGDKRFRTEKGAAAQVRSNVLSADGYGLTGVSVDVKPWYALPVKPQPSSITVTLAGGGGDNPGVRVSGDTVFITPAKRFGYDSLITVSITGQDTAGNRIQYVFDGDKRFRTEKGTPRKVCSNVLSADGYGLTGVPVDVKPWYSLPIVPLPSSVIATLQGGGGDNPGVRVCGDTVFITPAKKFGYDSLITVTITGLDTARNHFEYSFDGIERFRTETRILPKPASNVLTAAGVGLIGVPVGVKLWYALPVVLVPSSVGVTISGGGSPNAVVLVKKDTVFVDPVKDFAYDALVTVTITGIDTAGYRVQYTFDGTQQFRTEKAIFAIASNAWRTPGLPQRTFKLNDTIWVEYSEPLDTDLNKIDWAKSSAQNVIYGKGPGVNADVWVKADTLFVRPDQRLAIGYGQTMGFKASVVSESGKRSDSLDVVAQIVADSYYVKWTNTKDLLGNMRQDFGVMDSVVVVSSAPIAAIKGLSGISGKAIPADLTLDNVRLCGQDTIVYKPSIYLKPDSTYGLDFDLLFKDGTMRYDALGVTWKTALRIQILSVDNRQAGAFRPMLVIGDSLSVGFSAPIDTSSGAAVPFRVNLTDVRNRPVRTAVRWDGLCMAVTIKNNDTLPAADFDASPAYSSDAVNTRAVRSVTFNLTTKDGERVLGFKPKNEDIEMHTERGLCVVNSNVLQSHDERNGVDRTENTVIDFPLNGQIRITFNRALDTAAMKADTAGYAKFIGLKENTTAVTAAITCSSDAKTLTITPAADLKPLTNYYLWLKNVPGLGIAGAAAINKDAGSFTGKSSGYGLLDKAFQAK